MIQMATRKKIQYKIDLVGKNLPDILEWCKVRRPDLVPHMQVIQKLEAYVLLLAVAYAAGRSSVIAELEGTTITEVESRAGHHG